jgi:hypothetical protein
MMEGMHGSSAQLQSGPCPTTPTQLSARSMPCTEERWVSLSAPHAALSKLATGGGKEEELGHGGQGKAGTVAR